METLTPLGLDIAEPIMNSYQATPEDSMNNYKIYFNQRQTDKLSIIFPLNFIFLIIFGLFGGFIILKKILECGTLAIISGIFYILFFILLMCIFFYFQNQNK